MTSYLFTSESVSEGHPDKMCDQISDAILDAVLRDDPNGRVACETLTKTGLVMVAGEITTSTYADVDGIVRKTVTDIGYDNTEVGFDGNTCAVINELGEQSADIAQGVDRTRAQDQGAGDQGVMFGYASNETDALMPAPIVYAHRLMERQAKVRKEAARKAGKTGEKTLLRPDAKSQVTFRYEDGRPTGVHAVVLSTQHAELDELGLSLANLKEAVMETIIKPVLPRKWLNSNTRYHINPTGRFVTGGPKGDCGLTGRKIIVDTYGGMARHGGGAFSGKDPSKVDRSAAYAARYVAKNVVAAGLADRCEIQVSYAIGVAEPTSVTVHTFGTNRIPEEKICALVTRHFDLTPYGIMQMLDLLRPIYRKTAAYGHFGRDDPDFTWERTDRAEALRAAGRLAGRDAAASSTSPRVFPEIRSEASVPVMPALICGSIAYDTIMVFDDSFRNHILPDQIHILNVAFLVPELRREFGGCAMNIAYNLKLLGEEPIPMGTAGQDFEPYREWLRSRGIRRDHIRVLDDMYTDQVYITTDQDDNQITAVHPGAMAHSHLNSVEDAPEATIGILSPDGQEGMVEHAAQFAAAGVPFIFDPGQQLPLFSGEELRQFIEQANWVTVNDYEWQLLKNRTGWDEEDVVTRVDALIVTRGGKGSTIRTGGERIEIPAVKPQSITDPTGCGDAYRAGLLFGLLRGCDWLTTGRAASLMGAVKIECHGTQNHRFTPDAFERRFQDSFGCPLG